MPPAQVNQLCLDDAQLAALGELALQCEKVYGPRRDIEWAFQDGTLYLLQCRAVTTGKARSEAPPPGPPPRDPVAALQRVELFADMDRRQAEQIARLLKERRFAKGETVIMEGSGGAAFFLIDSGEARVSSKGVQLATLGPGDYFGEIALIDGGPRSATVTAATDLVCYGLTFWEFRPLVERNGAIAWKLLQALAKRLRANVGALSGDQLITRECESIGGADVKILIPLFRNAFRVAKDLATCTGGRREGTANEVVLDGRQTFVRPRSECRFGHTIHSGFAAIEITARNLLSFDGAPEDQRSDFRTCQPRIRFRGFAFAEVRNAGLAQSRDKALGIDGSLEWNSTIVIAIVKFLVVGVGDEGLQLLLHGGRIAPQIPIGWTSNRKPV